MPLRIIMRAAVAVVLLAGCAQGRATVAPSDGDILPPVDGTIEGEIDAMADAKLPPVDAKPDAPPVQPDAPPPPDAAPPPPTDAYQCTVMTRQLLLNPTFDLTPSGTNWVLQNIDNAYPIITDQDGLAEQSAPYKAWLGGFVATTAGTSVTDVLYQDVQIPMGTTMLTLTGYYAVGTQETGTTVYDTGNVALVQTNGTPIENVLSLSNAAPVSTWTAFTKTFTTNLSGQTVRLRFTSSNDDSFVSNFFFDTLALTATYCQ
jgi:hypothetical protein